MSTLSQLISSKSPAASLAALLDAASAQTRLEQTLALSAREQAKLFDQVDAAIPFPLDDLTPKRAVFEGVAHEGKNSLYAFRNFAKVFCVPDTAPNERWGYNRNPPLVHNTVGPGYFVALQHGPNEVLIDYTLTPPRKPESWPAIAHKYSKLSRFVFFGTQDVLRRVSEHVSIGRARRAGKWMDNWFVLCRV
jgi:hypothetical protein